MEKYNPFYRMRIAAEQERQNSISYLYSDNYKETLLYTTFRMQTTEYLYRDNVP